jgi:hypothetical protein
MRAGLGLLVLIAACDRGPAPPPYRPVVDVKELMSAILEPAAERYWDAVGTVVDERGTTEIAPKTAEEWEEVRRSALLVAESGNLLMMPSRVRDALEWVTFSRAMIDAASAAADSAGARRASAVFDAGAVLYETCTQCHAKYAVEQQRPNALPR